MTPDVIRGNEVKVRNVDHIDDREGRRSAVVASDAAPATSPMATVEGGWEVRLRAAGYGGRKVRWIEIFYFS